VRVANTVHQLDGGASGTPVRRPHSA
jgi:hypothetical protein